MTIVLPESGLSAGEELVAKMRRADPFGSFKLSKSTPGRDALTLRIGLGVGHASPATVQVASSGWHAAVAPHGQDLPYLPGPGDSGLVIGAIGAAAIGVAQVFKLATGATPLLSGGIFDFFNLERVPPGDAPGSPPIPNTLSVGDLLQVGAGSVGTSVLYCALVSGLRGNVTILDFDVVRLHNLPCSPLFGCSDVGLNKATVAAAAVNGSALAPLRAHPYPNTWDDFVSAGLRSTTAFDLWLPLANEQNVRWSMQNNHPPLMLQASTTKDWGVNFGRHLPGLDECLACRFPQSVSEADLACAQGPVAHVDAGDDASLPFLSMLAGVLVVAQILRLQVDPSTNGPNFAYLDLGSELNTIHAWNKRCGPGCNARSVADPPVANGRRYEGLLSTGCCGPTPSIPE